jgi:hypothetical protein
MHHTHVWLRRSFARVDRLVGPFADASAVEAEAAKASAAGFDFAEIGETEVDVMNIVMTYRGKVIRVEARDREYRSLEDDDRSAAAVDKKLSEEEAANARPWYMRGR